MNVSYFIKKVFSPEVVMLKAILILPFNVLVTFPFLLLWSFGYRVIAFEMSYPFFLMLMLFAGGLFLMIWTIRLFSALKKGSLAPWDPVEKLIINGPYAYVRNPMLIGVFLCLGGEALFFQSMALFYYLLCFIGISMLYFPLSEEKGLEKRFGEEYLLYKSNVPRFIPRLTPWRK